VETLYNLLNNNNSFFHFFFYCVICIYSWPKIFKWFNLFSSLNTQYSKCQSPRALQICHIEIFSKIHLLQQGLECALHMNYTYDQSIHFPFMYFTILHNSMVFKLIYKKYCCSHAHLKTAAPVDTQPQPYLISTLNGCEWPISCRHKCTLQSQWPAETGHWLVRKCVPFSFIKCEQESLSHYNDLSYGLDNVAKHYWYTHLLALLASVTGSS
jgi:hypothetical protein